MCKYTLTIIKPLAVKNSHVGEVLQMINVDGGFRIAGMKMITLSRQQVKEFYKVHKEKPFFDSLTNFMTSGPVVVAVLEKENAIEEYRKLIGKTDPKEALSGTIRKLYGINIQANCVHGSDTPENAIKEIQFFFSTSEIFDEEGNLIDVSIT